MIHYVVVELKNDHQSEKYISRKSRRPVNQRLKLTLFMVQPAIFTHPPDFSDIHRTDLCLFNFSTIIVCQFKLAYEWMTEFFDAFFWMNDWLSNVYSHKSLPRHYAEQGNVGSLLLSLTLFAAFIKPKMGFHYWTQLDAHIKKYHSVYKQKRNEFPFEREMQSSVFNEF